MNNKKAAEGMIWVLIAIVLALVFLLVYSGVWTKLFGGGASAIGNQIDSAGDADGDNAINLADKCPCKPGDSENNGCPIGYTPNKNEDKSCLKKK